MQVERLSSHIPPVHSSIVPAAGHSSRLSAEEKAVRQSSRGDTAVVTSFKDEVLAAATAQSEASGPSDEQSNAAADAPVTDVNNAYWRQGLERALSNGNGYKAGILSRLAIDGNEAAVQQALNRYVSSHPSPRPELVALAETMPGVGPAAPSVAEVDVQGMEAVTEVEAVASPDVQVAKESAAVPTVDTSAEPDVDSAPLEPVDIAARTPEADA